MAQDFTRYAVQATNSAGTIFTANSNDAVIGIRIANIVTSAIKIDVFVSVGGSTTRFICKDLSIPPNSAVELVSGGAKFVMQSTDVLKVESDTASSADVYVSVVDSISAQEDKWIVYIIQYTQVTNLDQKKFILMLKPWTIRIWLLSLQYWLVQ